LEILVIGHNNLLYKCVISS